MRSRTLWILLLLCCGLAPAAQAAESELKRLSISVRKTPCSALLLRPPDARALLVLAHGQSMDVQHPFMESLSVALARVGIATLRFNFLFAEAKRPRVDAQPLLLDAVLAAVREAEQQRGALPLFLGGQSVGGMMAAMALPGDALPDVRGLVVFSYPLHAPGRPSGLNAGKLRGLTRPALFLQGTRDPLGDLPLMTAVVEGIGPQAKLVLVRDADHGFALPEGSARTPEQVFEELAGAVSSFVATIAPQSGD